MKVLGQILLGACILAPLVDAPGFGYDTLRLPLIFALILAFAIARTVGPAPDAPAARWAWWGGVALVLLQVLSWLGAVDCEAALDATLRVAAGFFMFAAVSRRWIAIDQLPRLAAAAAIVEGVAVLAGWPLLGNSNYAGCMLSMLACVCMASALGSTVRRERIIFGVAVIVAAAGLWASESRAGLVGLAVGSTLILLRGPGAWKVKGAVAGVLLLAAGVASRDRIASIFSTEAPTNRVRLEVWKGTLSLAAAHPVVGCGAGNFRAQYPPHRLESEAEIHDGGRLRLTEAEDPHNTHLSLLAETGAVSALVWLGWLGLLVVTAWRRRETAALAAVAAFAAAGCFNTLREFSPFDLWLWTWAGVIARGEGEAEARPLARRWLELAAVALSAFAIEHSIRGAVAQWSYDAGMRSADAAARRDAMQVAIDWKPGWWAPHYQMGDTYHGVALSAGAAGRDFHRQALREAELALERMPWSLSALNLAAVSAMHTDEIDAAREFLEKAERTAPWYYLTQINRARIEDDPKAIRRRLERALEKKPLLGKDPDFMRMLR